MLVLSKCYFSLDDAKSIEIGEADIATLGGLLLSVEAPVL